MNWFVALMLFALPAAGIGHQVQGHAADEGEEPLSFLVVYDWESGESSQFGLYWYSQSFSIEENRVFWSDPLTNGHVVDLADQDLTEYPESGFSATAMVGDYYYFTKHPQTYHRIDLRTGVEEDISEEISSVFPTEDESFFGGSGSLLVLKSYSNYTAPGRTSGYYNLSVIDVNTWTIVLTINDYRERFDLSSISSPVGLAEGELLLGNHIFNLISGDARILDENNLSYSIDPDHYGLLQENDTLLLINRSTNASFLVDLPNEFPVLGLRHWGTTLVWMERNLDYFSGFEESTDFSDLPIVKFFVGLILIGLLVALLTKSARRMLSLSGNEETKTEME